MAFLDYKLIDLYALTCDIIFGIYMNMQFTVQIITVH